MPQPYDETPANLLLAELGPVYGEALALRTYTARLLGADPSLVLHGGGNTSVKGRATTLLGEDVEVVWVKASGLDLATIEPTGHVALDLARLRRLRELGELADARLDAAVLACRLDPHAPPPSLEAPVHGFLPPRFLDHSHADAILALSNRPDGENALRRALGAEVILLPYVLPGLGLAQASAEAFAARPGALGMVWRQHGLLTWGETARESYDRHLELVERAREHLEGERARAARALRAEVDLAAARRRLAAIAPVVRGALTSLWRPAGTAPGEAGAGDRPILASFGDEATLAFLALPGARDQALTPPLTTDHLIRIGAEPLWLEAPDGAAPEDLRAKIAQAGGVAPRLILVPGAGALAVGRDVREARIAADVAAHNLAVKAAQLAAGIPYQGLAADHLQAMLTRPQQLRKLASAAAPLSGTIALVTGAAGAIGGGICRVLAASGAAVAATDLAGPALDALAAELAAGFPGLTLALPLDVTEPASVAAAFDAVALAWGGVDLVVPNAGVAHVASLEELDLETFRRLERVNSEGTLLVLAEAARRFRRQAMGGDVVLVSTKNVPAPGASFGAYSATKAAAHQLARIASLELAPLGVRVNMVAPDAVFGEGERRSGLWSEVGPSRMKARGLSATELEGYYQGRNLLKARITPQHVGEAVLFFASRKTPTTGVTLPVDGGLPDATPR